MLEDLVDMRHAAHNDADRYLNAPEICQFPSERQGCFSLTPKFPPCKFAIDRLGCLRSEPECCKQAVRRLQYTQIVRSQTLKAI